MWQSKWPRSGGDRSVLQFYIILHIIHFSILRLVISQSYALYGEKGKAEIFLTLNKQKSWTCVALLYISGDIIHSVWLWVVFKHETMCFYVSVQAAQAKTTSILKSRLGSVSVPVNCGCTFWKLHSTKPHQGFLTLFIPFTIYNWLPTWPPRLQCL